MLYHHTFLVLYEDSGATSERARRSIDEDDPLVLFSYRGEL